MFCTFKVMDCIKSIGYSPYNWFINSDHRALIVDFDERLLLGKPADPMPSPNLRGCRSNDRNHVATMIHQWHKHLRENNIFELLQSQQLTSTLTSQEIEKADRLVGQGGDSGEKLCKRRRPAYYSNTIAQARTLKSITKGNLHALQQGKDLTAVFQERLNQYGICFEIANTMETAAQQYTDTQHALTTLLANNREIRTQELEEKIDKATATKKRSRAKALQSIKKLEGIRQTWQTLKFVKMQQGSSQKLDRLDIPASWPDKDADDSSPTAIQLEDPKQCRLWKTVTNPDEIEYYLQLRNKSHFGQAQGTPFTESPFVNSLDWPAQSETCEAILAGTYTTDVSTVPQCQALLTACKTVSDLDIIPAEITANEFAGKIKSWNEFTSTSPSGRHLGRYKALYAKGPYTADTPEGKADMERLTKEQQEIRQVIITIMNYCIRTGYVLERWKTIVNTMIFKDNGNYKIHRLRVIHIYEADFNLLLAVKWRQLLRSADSRDAINHGLFGGRPGCEAQSLTFLEELKYDIAYTSRRTLFNFDNDATSCYDRIIVSLASLINRRFGLHRKITMVHASTLQQARFHLRTQLGYSDKYYSHSIQFPIYGSGQGSGNSPCIWLFISSTLCDVHQTISHGATFTSPDGEDTAKITMVGFVDDSTGTCNDFRPQAQESTADIAKRMQHDAQAWNDLLWCSGGKLELSKCSFHVLEFEFDADGTPHPILPAPDYDILLQDAETDEAIKIKPKRADEPHKTLGHWKSPAEPKQRKQLQELLGKAKNTMALIAISPLTRAGTVQAYNGVYVTTTLKYVLPQCFFTDKQLEQTERKTIQPILARCGYNRNTAIALRYTPTTYAGCGLTRWSTLQGEGQIGLFLKHWRTTTIISHVLRIAISWSQWQAGLPKSILKDTTTPTPHLESRWMTSLRTFLAKINASLHLDHSKTVPEEREGDIYIMEYAIQCRIFTDADIKIINYCRQYLHVTTISELFDADGTRLLRYMQDCEKPPWQDKNQFGTIQRRPSIHQIKKKWQTLCRQWSRRDGTRLESTVLGKWTHRGTKYRQRRETYNEGGKIYHWTNGCYWVLLPSIAQNGYFILDRETQWTPTDLATPTRIVRIPTPTGHEYYTRTDISYTATDPDPSHDNQLVARPNFQEYIQGIPEWERKLLHGTEFHTNAYQTMTDIIEIANDPDQVLFMVSDGACQHDTTSFGWTIGDELDRQLAWGKGPGYGQATSHRAECWGALAMARFLHHLRLFTKQEFPATMTLRVYSDSQGMISSLQKRMEYKSLYPGITLQKDWDLLEETHSTYTAIAPSSLKYKWVKGHQKKIYPDDDDLPPEALYNISSDKLANEYMNEHPTPRPISALVASGRCLLQIKNATIHEKHIPRVREAVALPDLFTYLKGKYTWDQSIINDINWKWFTAAATRYNHTDNHIMKLVYDQLPTRTRKAKTGGEKWIPSICHHCKAEPETFDHLLRCTHETSIKFRAELPIEIVKYCNRGHAPVNFGVTLRIAVEDWLQNREPLADTDRPQVKDLAQAQQKIGWTRLLRGFFSKHWLVYLEQEFNNSGYPIPLSIDTKAFFSGLIRTMWTCQSKFWTEHQADVHKPEKDTTSAATVAETRAEVQYLYSIRYQVPTQQREEYFPKSIRDFLKSSSHQQLRTYVENYKPAIRKSIKIAKDQANKAPRIFNYQGFTRTRRAAANTRTSTSTHDLVLHTGQQNEILLQPPTGPSPTPLTADEATLPDQPDRTLKQMTLTDTIPPATTIQHQVQKEKIHKHSKWKMMHVAQDRFKNFFVKK
jgi:hypothetical protein